MMLQTGKVKQVEIGQLGGFHILETAKETGHSPWIVLLPSLEQLLHLHPLQTVLGATEGARNNRKLFGRRITLNIRFGAIG